VKRRLFNAGALVSLALCVAVVMLWVTSYRSTYWLHYRARSGDFSVGSWSGSLVVACDPPVVLPKGFAWGTSPGRPGLSGLWSLHFKHVQRLPFNETTVRPNVRPQLSYELVFPHWLMLLATALPFASWLRTRRGRSGGLCPGCGYDLRGTPSGAAPGTPGSDSGGGSGSPSRTCPECGAASAFGGDPA
jgi:hypothetical protein